MSLFDKFQEKMTRRTVLKQGGIGAVAAGGLALGLDHTARAHLPGWAPLAEGEPQLRTLTDAEYDDFLTMEHPTDEVETLRAIERGDKAWILANVHFKPFSDQANAADAACQPGGCFVTYECRCSTSCGPNERTWTTRHCCAGCGCGWIVYAPQPGACGCHNPNC